MTKDIEMMMMVMVMGALRLADATIFIEFEVNPSWPKTGTKRFCTPPSHLLVHVGIQYEFRFRYHTHVRTEVSFVTLNDTFADCRRVTCGATIFRAMQVSRLRPEPWESLRSVGAAYHRAA